MGRHGDKMPGYDPHVFCVGEAGDKTLDAWLEEFPPSKTSTRGSAQEDGWLWVRTKTPPSGKSEVCKGDEGDEQRDEELNNMVEQYREAIKEAQRIKEDTSIPVRKGKDGKPTKKQLRDELAEKMRSSLKELGDKGGWTCGKWLFYPSREYVDYVWGKLARSVIDGPLSKLQGVHVHTIKVATADDEDPSDQKKQDSSLGSTVVICLYFDNVWERSHAEKVLRCALTEHGEEPSGCKADLYTLVGINSKNPLDLRSTLWQVKDFVSKEESQDLRDAFKAKSGQGAGGKKVVKAKAVVAGDQGDDDGGFEDDDGSQEEQPAKKRVKM